MCAARSERTADVTELQIVEDAIVAVQAAMTIGVPLLTAVDPPAGVIAGPGITALYEGLVKLRDRLMTETNEEQLADLRARITEAAQDNAAAKFGAQPDQGQP